MTIDFHTHIFPPKIAASALRKLSANSRVRPFTGATREGLIDSMEQGGVDYSVLLPVATRPEQVRSINDQALQAEKGDRLIQFGCMHPDLPNWKEELDRIADWGVKGIKIHPFFQERDLDDIRYLRILERAGELGLIVVTHAGKDIGYPGLERSTPQMALHVVKEVGPVTLVLAHMGGWREWICDLPLTKEEKRAILGENARKLLGI